MAELESKTQERVMQYARKRGCYIYKNAQNMYTEKGRPDLTACVPVTTENLLKLLLNSKPDEMWGLFVGIEMKRPGKIDNTSEAQKVVGRQINKAGGIWLPVDNVSQVEKLLDSLGVHNAIQ